MNKLLSIIVIIIISAGAVSLGVWQFHRPPEKHTTNQVAQKCPNQTVSQHYADADIVMTGSVTGVLPAGKMADVWVTPSQVFKGEVTTPNLKIVAHPVTPGTKVAVTDELNFRSDDPPYLLFLQARSDGRYETSRCAGSRLFGEGLTLEEQAVLEKTINQNSPAHV